MLHIHTTTLIIIYNANGIMVEANKVSLLIPQFVSVSNYIPQKKEKSFQILIIRIR